MKDQDKTKDELIEELAEMRQRIAAMEGFDAEPKQADQKLRENEQRFRKVFEEGPVGILLVGTDGRIQHVNRRFREMLGYSESEIIALGLPGISHPDDWARDHPFFSRLWHGEISHYDSEKRYSCKDGRVVWGQLTISVMHDKTGRPMNTVGMVEDITVRKQAEEALQKAHDELEQRVKERTAELAKANEQLQQAHDELRAIYDGMPDGVLVADIETKQFVRCNVAMGRMLGFPEDELLARSVMDIHPADELPSVLQTFHALVDGKQRIGHDIPMLRKDGSVFHADVTHHEIKLNGRRCTVGFFRDTSERKMAEDALRASEERFRVTFEEAPVGMVICVGDGVITKTNRALCRISGYTQEELIGRHVRDLAHPEDRELSGPLVKKLLAGTVSSFTLEKRYLRRGGQPFWAQATTAAIQGPDGKIAFGLGVVEDIDDRKQAEEALRQSERRFRNYFEQGLIGMAVTSVDKRWLEVNDRLCEILGYCKEELLQKTWAEVTYPDDLEPNIQLLNRLLAGDTEYFTLNKRYVKKGGSIVYTTIHTRAFRRDDGTIDHIVTLVEDITARKQAEEALERERQSLWRMLQASDHERQIISYEIHDGLAQYLAAAAMQFQAHDSLQGKLAGRSQESLSDGCGACSSGPR